MSTNTTNKSSKIRVGIIGAGSGGLTLANGLLNDPQQRYDVIIYERDTVAFSLERGGYVLRIANNGFQALKSVAYSDTWRLLQQAWREPKPKAPSMVDPKSFQLIWRLSDTVLYPKSLPIARTSLREALIQKPLAENIIRFGVTFSRFEIIGDGSDHKVVIHFEEPEKNPPTEVDILIAADGSRSRINQQVGLNNKSRSAGFLSFWLTLI